MFLPIKKLSKGSDDNTTAFDVLVLSSWVFITVERIVQVERKSTVTVSFVIYASLF